MIVRRHKAPSVYRGGYVLSEKPTRQDIADILRETPDTMFLTIFRRAAAYLNCNAVECLFEDASPLAVLPTDPESNGDNYDGSRQIGEEPLQLPIFVGAPACS